jgi:hypothetical protein
LRNQDGNFFFILSIRLFYIQALTRDRLTNLAKSQYEEVIEIKPLRGIIFDRNLKQLATNVAIYSVYAEAKRIDQKQAAANAIANALGMGREDVLKRISKDKYFVWIARKVPDENRYHFAHTEFRPILRIRIFSPLRGRGRRSMCKFSFIRNGMLMGRKGVYEAIHELDFTSLYPSIIVLFNLSPETLYEPKKRGFLPSHFSQAEQNLHYVAQTHFQLKMTWQQHWQRKKKKRNCKNTLSF